MKKKILSIAVAFASVALTANAQSYIMQIHKVDGTVTEINADDVDRVTFAEMPEAVETVPSGTDLTAWYAENASSLADSVVAIPLAAGGQYTMSGDIDFASMNANLYTVDAANPATVTLTADASLRTYAPLTVNGVNFDCSASNAAFIKLSANPDSTLVGATGAGDYFNIMGTLQIANCKIDGVNGQLIYDDNVKYCLETCIIDNTVVKLTSSSATGVSGNAVIYFKGGFINDFTVHNSTFWQASTESDAKYFVQYNNSGRADRGGYEMNYVNFTNSTFYNIAGSGQWANYSGFSGKKTSTFVMTDCIFVDCAADIARRFIGGSFSTNPVITFANNTYLKDAATGTYDSEENFDKSGTAIKSDPMFADPANGDFTVGGAEQQARRTGDPRWLAAE